MIARKRLFLVLMVMVALVTFAACRNSDSNDTELQSGLDPSLSGSDLLTTIVSGTTPKGESITSSGVSTVQLVVSGSGGISVSGRGSVTVSPDTAIITVGVQARRDTVAEARNDAAEAMTAIVAVLRDEGVAEEDIKTQFLSINPVYNYREDPPELTGFDVVNNVRVTVRDLDSVGPIIDGVAEAGGDLTRINGISFTIDDPSPFQAELREKAVGDAMSKAQQLATLAGVVLGPAISISEGGGIVPVNQTGFRDFAVAEAALEFAPTPISAGELELNLSVSMVFAIQ